MDWEKKVSGIAHSILKEEETDSSRASECLPAAWVLFLNNTPEAEVLRMSQSLCLGKRNLCLLESLGEEREEMVTLESVNCSSLAVRQASATKALCIMREEKATQSPQAGNNPACIVAIS